MGADSVGAAVVASPVISGAVVLPTCNRYEVYVEAADAASAREALVATIAAASPLSPAEIDDALETFEGDDAVRHLLSVATGLESMVIGEREISGQVRRAHADARAGGVLTPQLDKLFQSALRTSRVVACTRPRTRSQTAASSARLEPKSGGLL